MTNIRTALYALAASGVIAGPAFAGSLAEPAVTAPPPAPAPVVATGGDWGGFYGGLQLGYADITGENGLAGISGDGMFYGIHAGYNWDFGQWVIGGELDYDNFDIDLLTTAPAVAATVDNVARLKLKAGYDLGRTLVYGTAGIARLDSTAGDDDGAFYGLGVSYQINNNFILGGELLRHDFSDIGGAAGVDAEADTISVRASFRF